MENETKFLEVVLNCPFNDPLSDCAFNSYRKMSIAELIGIITAADSTKMDNLMAQHTECVRKRKINKLAG